MPKRLSIQSGPPTRVLQGASVDELIAREDEQERFRSVLELVLRGPEAPDEGFLVLVHGLGGLGKSELLKRYEAMASGRAPGCSEFVEQFTVSRIADIEKERERHPG